MASEPAAGAERGPALEVAGLRTALRSGGRTLFPVDGVQFTVERGRALAIVGESGSGKSLTALSIMRLLPPVARVIEGSARVNGLDMVTAADTTVRRLRGARITMIFQDPLAVFNPSLRIGAQMVEAALYHRIMTRREADAGARRLLRSMGIGDAEGVHQSFPHQLSGGMRQRAALAMAVLPRPDVVIADEPTTALDVTTQEQILDILRQFQRERSMGLVLITHDMGVVAGVADDVLVMYAGRMVERGPVLDVFRSARHPYTRALLESVDIGRHPPRLHLTAIRGAPARLDQLPGGCAFHPRCPHAREICALSVPPPVAFGRTVAACHFAGDPGFDPSPPAEPAPGVRPAAAAPAAAPPPALLRVEGLTRVFHSHSLLGVGGRAVRAVNGVSFDVGAGETLGLVGESGCGKSTTARLVLRLIEPSGGRVVFDGVDITGREFRRFGWLRRRMQVVFQDPFSSLNPRMTIGELLEEPFVIHRIAPREGRAARARELLDMVGLPGDAVRRRPGEFSGGQQQRIAIARAIALGPKLVIADEALSALDVSVQASVVNLLLDLQSRLGVSYVFISHNLATVRHLSHRVAVMYLGHIVELASAESLYERPKHPYTQALLAAIPLLDPERERARSRAHLPGDPPSPAQLPEGCPFRSRCWMATERCRAEAPALRVIDAGHLVACHYAEQSEPRGPRPVGPPGGNSDGNGRG